MGKCQRFRDIETDDKLRPLGLFLLADKIYILTVKPCSLDTVDMKIDLERVEVEREEIKMQLPPALDN